MILLKSQNACLLRHKSTELNEAYSQVCIGQQPNSPILSSGIPIVHPDSRTHSAGNSATRVGHEKRVLRVMGRNGKL